MDSLVEIQGYSFFANIYKYIMKYIIKEDIIMKSILIISVLVTVGINITGIPALVFLLIKEKKHSKRLETELKDLMLKINNNEI